MNFNKSTQYPTSFSMMGLWMTMIVLLLLVAPKGHSRLTQDIYPQSPVQLVQQLTAAIEAKQLGQIMRLFNWDRHSTEEVERMNQLWAQTLSEEVLAEIKIMPVSTDYQLTKNDNEKNARVAIQGELRIIFKSRQENGFLSTIKLKLPYGTMLINEGLYTYSVSLLVSPAI